MGNQVKALHVHTRELWKKFTGIVRRLAAGKPDQERMDIARIQLSAQLLQISEFRFFQLAYEQWYGRELDEKTMEYIFAGYILKNEMPHWARHLSRIVTTRYFEGNLDPHEFNINCPAPPVDHEKKAPVHTVIMTFIYIIFYLILSGQIH